MKTKKFNKKLGLNKKTIANLDKSDMIKIYGGTETGMNSCPPLCYPTVNITNCVSNCLCGTLGPECPTLAGSC